MLCLCGFELYSRWVPLFFGQRPTEKDVDRMERFGDGVADVIEAISVQFNQFCLAKINYNTYMNCKLAGSPEETRRLMKPGLPSHKEINKVKIRGQ